MNISLQECSSQQALAPVRILVADDHEVMRLGIRNLLQSQPHWSVCAEAGDGHEAVEKTRQFCPDLIILDISMPTMTGLEAARHISQSHPEIPIILFSLHVSDNGMRDLERGNIRGAVDKNQAGRDLVTAVGTVLRGGTFFPHQMLVGKASQ